MSRLLRYSSILISRSHLALVLLADKAQQYLHCHDKGRRSYKGQVLSGIENNRLGSAFAKGRRIFVGEGHNMTACLLAILNANTVSLEYLS